MLRTPPINQPGFINLGVTLPHEQVIGVNMIQGEAASREVANSLTTSAHAEHIHWWTMKSTCFAVDQPCINHVSIMYQPVKKNITHCVRSWEHARVWWWGFLNKWRFQWANSLYVEDLMGNVMKNIYNGGPPIAMFAYRRVVLHQIHPLLFEDMFPVCSLSQNLAKHMFYHHFGVYRVLNLKQIQHW